MTQQKQGVRELRVVFETTQDNFVRTDNYMMNRITDALAQVRNTNLSVTFFDDDGHVIRKVEFGEPSAEMQRLIEEDAS